MQYVVQTCLQLKTRFGEHYRKIIKAKMIDTFLINTLNVVVILNKLVSDLDIDANTPDS